MAKHLSKAQAKELMMSLKHVNEINGDSDKAHRAELMMDINRIEFWYDEFEDALSCVKYDDQCIINLLGEMKVHLGSIDNLPKEEDVRKYVEEHVL